MRFTYARVSHDKHISSQMDGPSAHKKCGHWHLDYFSLQWSQSRNSNKQFPHMRPSSISSKSYDTRLWNRDCSTCRYRFICLKSMLGNTKDTWYHSIDVKIAMNRIYAAVTMTLIMDYIKSFFSSLSTNIHQQYLANEIQRDSMKLL